MLIASEAGKVSSRPDSNDFSRRRRRWAGFSGRFFPHTSLSWVVWFDMPIDHLLRERPRRRPWRKSTPGRTQAFRARTIGSWGAAGDLALPILHCSLPEGWLL